MKRNAILKVLFLLCCFSLIGCINSGDHSNEQKDTPNDEVNESISSESKRKSTSNPLEVIKDDSYDVFQHGSAELDIVGRYISEDSDSDGVIELEKNGYRVKFTLVLVHSPVVNENSIYVLGEHENTNKDGDEMGIPESVIKTNEQEELRDTFTTRTLESNSKAIITNMIFLDENMKPDSIEIILKEPSEIEDDSAETNRIDKNIKDWKVITFQRK